MHLVLIEPKAHNPGHYTEELFQFCKHVIKYFDSIVVLTPFGFREEWDEIVNCKVYILCSKLAKDKNNLERNFNPIYGSQWQFFKLVKKFLKNWAFTDTIVHVWDFKSVFPLWFFVNNSKYTLIINLKAVYKVQEAFLGSKFIGNMQGFLSRKLLAKLGDKYVVHTHTVLIEAAQIGIPKSKVYNIGLGVGSDFKALDKLSLRNELNLPTNSFLILFFGVIREEKGIYEILDHINSTPQNISLFIVGESHLDISLEELINRHHLNNKVFSKLTYIPEKELGRYFRVSDAVVICHQRHFKGESGVFLKAIQYEVPVIADIASHSSKVIESDKVGAIFDLLKPGDISNAVKFIEENNNRIKHNLKNLKKRKSWEETVNEYYRLYFD